MRPLRVPVARAVLLVTPNEVFGNDRCRKWMRLTLTGMARADQAGLGAARAALLRAAPEDQDRAGCQARELFGNATDEQMLGAGSPLSCEQDQVDVLFLGVID